VAFIPSFFIPLRYRVPIAARLFPVDTTIHLKVELIETETGLAVWVHTFELGTYSKIALEWKQKLTESLVEIVAATEAHSSNQP
jgi:hypothetical protein